MGSSVGVSHDRLGVVIGEGVIQPGFDDPLGRLRRRACRDDALLPQPQVPQDAFDHRPVVDQRDNPHLARTAGTEERIGFPHLLDEFAPLRRWHPARFVSRHVDDLHGLTCGLGLFGDTFVPPAAYLVAVPAVVPDELEAIVRDVRGDGGDEVAQREPWFDPYLQGGLKCLPHFSRECGPELRMGLDKTSDVAEVLDVLARTAVGIAPRLDLARERVL